MDKNGKSLPHYIDTAIHIFFKGLIRARDIDVYFVSLHHKIKLDMNFSALGYWDDNMLKTVQGASGILMPKYFSPTRYRQILAINQNHFPNLLPRFSFRGKANQTRLFQEYNIPHPKTLIFKSPQNALDKMKNKDLPLALPFVLKGNTGAGGSSVYPIRTTSEYRQGLKNLPPKESILVQEWVDNQGRDLRVVKVGQVLFSYFRLSDGAFHNNLARGGKIDYESDPEEQELGKQLVDNVAQKTGIDIAGFDVMFPKDHPPLIIEINFLFGTKGLGGYKGYQFMLYKAINKWIKGLGGNYPYLPWPR